MEQDDREGIVREYLDMLLPDAWDDMDMYRRRDYFRDPTDPTRPEGVRKRTEVSNLEIWCECFEESVSRLGRREANEIVAMLIKLGWTRTDKSKRIAPYGKQKYCIKPVRIDENWKPEEAEKDEFSEVDDLIAIEEMLQ